MEEVQQLPGLIQELSVLQAMKTYFQSLRHLRGHNPEGSPIDREILVILRFVVPSVENPVNILHNVGIIIIGDDIAINANYLKVFLSTCRSRINNSMKHLGWNLKNLANNEKFDLLQPLVDRKEARNWTVRVMPASSEVLAFIRENPQLRWRTSELQQPEQMNLPLGSMLEQRPDDSSSVNFGVTKTKHEEQGNQQGAPSPEFT